MISHVQVQSSISCDMTAKLSPVTFTCFPVRLHRVRSFLLLCTAAAAAAAAAAGEQPQLAFINCPSFHVEVLGGVLRGFKAHISPETTQIYTTLAHGTLHYLETGLGMPVGTFLSNHTAKSMNKGAWGVFTPGSKAPTPVDLAVFVSPEFEPCECVEYYLQHLHPTMVLFFVHEPAKVGVQGLKRLQSMHPNTLLAALSPHVVRNAQNMTSGTMPIMWWLDFLPYSPPTPSLPSSQTNGSADARSLDKRHSLSKRLSMAFGSHRQHIPELGAAGSSNPVSGMLSCAHAARYLQEVPPGCLEGWAVQGKAEGGRRNYSELWTGMASLPPQQRAEVHLSLVGKGTTGADFMKSIPSGVREFVYLHAGLPHVEFLGMLRRFIGMLPMFGSVDYLTKKLSSTAIISLATNTPMLMTRAELDAYNFFDESSAYLQGSEEDKISAILRILAQGPQLWNSTRAALASRGQLLHARAAFCASQMVSLATSLPKPAIPFQPQAAAKAGPDSMLASMQATAKSWFTFGGRSLLELKIALKMQRSRFSKTKGRRAGGSSKGGSSQQVLKVVYKPSPSPQPYYEPVQTDPKLVAAIACYQSHRLDDWQPSDST